MKDYLKKNGIRIGIIVAAVALIIGLGSAARNGKISLGQNAFGIFKAPRAEGDELHGQLVQHNLRLPL